MIKLRVHPPAHSIIGKPGGRRRVMLAAVFGVLAMMMVSPTLATAAEIFVAPNGLPANSGARTQPIDLATALSRNSPARPGDTIWLLGGTYRGTYTSYIAGTANAPITVRQFPGERAVLDNAGAPGDLLTVYGEWAVFWGFELTSSDPRRISSQTGPWPTDLYRGGGINAWGPNLKFINLVFHDLASGMGLWKEAVNSEVYGSLFFHNGWEAPDGSHGHGLYTQNQSGSRLIRENISFNQFSTGIHAYGSSVAFLNNITMEGNVVFNNGILGRSGFERDLLIGGGVVAQNPVFRENYTYGGAQSNLGYGAGCVNGQVLDNYFVGSTPLILVACNPVMTGNVFYNLQAAQWGWGATNFRIQDYPANAYYAQPPTTNFIKVRPNIYEPGRGNVVIYNWQRQSTVLVDIAPLGLAIGDAFEIRDAQDFFGSPVVSGVYNGSPVPIPMVGLRLEPPVGNVTVIPQHTPIEFGVFVIMRPSSASSSSQPTAAAPSIGPAGGTFTGPLTVSLSTPTTGATIRYTLDGTTPVATSPSYTAPFLVAATTTVMARTFATGMFDSALSVATFTIALPTTTTPTISPAGGSFSAPVTVTLASPTPGATVRYTTDGSTPTTASTVYMTPFVVSATTTLKARAFASGLLDSQLATAVYTITAPPPPPVVGTAAAAFVRLDATTKGNWKGVYGGDGATVVGDTTAWPGYAQVATSGQTGWTWAPLTADARALQRVQGTTRVAAAWYAGAFSMDVNITDGQAHQLALYCLDWDTADRAQRVDIRDATTGTLLDTRAVSTFNGGVYAVWQLRGHVTVQVTRTGGYNAMVSGVFFDALSGASAASPVIGPAGGTFSAPVTVSLTSTTFGATIRYSVDGSTPTNASPVYAGPFVLSQTAVVSARASAAGLADSTVSSATFTINTPTASAPFITPGGGSFGGAVTVSISSATNGATIRYTTDGSTPSGTSPVYAGPFAVSTSATIKARASAAGVQDSSVTSASFTITASPIAGGGPTATFVGLDTTTQGTWRGVYGSDGAMVVGDAATYPAYAQVTPSGQTGWTWNSFTTDVRGLQRVTTSSRVAAAWYGTAFSIDVNLTDGQIHQVAIYAADWDTVSRAQRVDIRDATTGALLDSRSLASFNGGQYLVWQLRGHVTIQFTSTGGYNALVNGLFFR